MSRESVGENVGEKINKAYLYYNMVPKLEYDYGSAVFDAYFFSHPMFRQSSEWQEEIAKRNPEFKKMMGLVQGDLSQDNLFKKVKDEFLRLYNGHSDEITKSIIRFQNNWDSINNDYLKVLSDVLETSWNDEYEIIDGLVTVMPMAPRDLKRQRFNVPYSDSDERAKMISAHELTHFLYFKKLKEMEPEIEEKTFDAPHHNWVISELLAPVILNDPRISNIIGPTTIETYVCGRKDSQKAYEKYLDHLQSRKPFSDYYRSILSLAKQMDFSPMGRLN